MLGEITGIYMIDEEGELESVDVNAKFVNGKPDAIEAKYVMRSPLEWDRFMRFMERYAESNGLGFQGVRLRARSLCLLSLRKHAGCWALGVRLRHGPRGSGSATAHRPGSCIWRCASACRLAARFRQYRTLGTHMPRRDSLLHDTLCALQKS